MWKHFKKYISIVLIFSLMLNILSTGFAQAVSEYENINIKEIEINAISSSLKEMIAAEKEKKTYKENFIKQTEQEDKETFLTRQRLKKYFQKEYQFNRVMDSFNQQLYSQAAQEWKKLDYKEDKFNLDAQTEVCYGETCYPYKIFMKALISAWLEYHVQGEAVLSIYNAKYLQEAAFLGAISLEDKRELFNLLKEGIKQERYVCGKSDDKEEKCEDILAGLTVLSEIWETDTESKEVSDLIYKILEKYYDSKFGIMVLIQSIAALSFIDTDYSYSLIEKFLTQDTAPTKIGNKTREALEMFSITGEYETWTEYLNNLVKEGAHYLNRHNIIWQYIKEEETKKEKVDPVFINTPGKVLDKNKNFVLASYRVVYGNILTDIGEFLSNQEGRGKRLATKIVKQYINASKEELKKIHIPLVLGLIQNLDSGDAALAADRLQRTFYYDINSGTGKWVQEKATIGGKYAYNYPPNVRSEKDYLDFVKTKKLTTFGDILIIFASLITLAKKIPDMIFQLKNLANLIKLRRMASYGSAVVVKNVADVAKTAKVTPAIAAVAPKTAITVSGTAGAANVLSKIRNVAKTPILLTKGANDGLSLAAPTLTLTSSSLSVKNSFSLADGVFKLIDPEGQFSGFLAEIPVFGINRQVIISAGHAIGVMPEAPVIVLGGNNNIKTTAHLVFSDFVEKENEIIKDFSLLLPMHRLPRTPLQLDFNPKLEDYNKFWYIGYPNGKFLMKNLHPVFEKTAKNILTFDGKIDFGGSGGLVLGEKQGQFFGLGTGVAKHWKEGSWNTKVYTFNWLDKFIKGKLDISKLWAPNFRESFIKPNKSGNLPDIPYNDGIISPKVNTEIPQVKTENPKNFTIAPTAMTSYKKSLSALVREAEGWGLPHEEAMSIAYDLPENVAKKRLQDYIWFMEEGAKESTVAAKAERKKLAKNTNLPGFVEGNYIPAVYPVPFNTKVKKMRVLIANDDYKFQKDLQKFMQESEFAKYIEEADFVSAGQDVIDKLAKDPSHYDIIFTDYYMANKKGEDVAQYIFDNNLDIPIILLAEIEFPAINLFAKKHFTGYLNIFQNNMDAIFSYASNMLVENGKVANVPSTEIENIELNIKSNKLNILPTISFSPITKLNSPVLNKASAAEDIEDLSNSVFRLENAYNMSFSGFLTEIPIYGVKRQAIITAGHGVFQAPGSSIEIYDKYGNFVDEAHTMFFNNSLVGNGMQKMAEDYALLLPDHKISAKPLELTFDDIYDYKEAIKVGYPLTNFEIQAASPDEYIWYIQRYKNMKYLDVPNIAGSSGGAVFVKTYPNKFSVIGTSVANLKREDRGKEFTVVQNLSWLEKFIKGEPIRAFFRNPIFPPSPFILSNHRYAKIVGSPINISGQISDEKKAILSGKKSNLQITNTSFQFDKPYLPWESFNSYEKATLFPMGNIQSKTSPFWLVSDVKGNINKFLYYGTETDVHRMHLFGQIIKENNLDTKYQLIDIEYPEFITVIDEDLPLNVSKDFAEIKENAHYRKEEFVPYTTTPIKLNGAVWMEKEPSVNAKFRESSSFANNPITQAEWDEVEALIQDINNYDFIFDDLEGSIILRRNTQGKLVVGFKKFKNSVLLSDNYSDVNAMGKHYENIGLKADKTGVVRNISKNNIELDPNVLKNVTRAEIVVTDYGPDVVTHAVWRLYDNVGKIVGYLKYGTEDELVNMKKMHKIITENNLLDKFDAINIQYQRILTENPEKFLPKKVLDEAYHKFTSNINLIRNPGLRAKVMFVTAPIEFEAFCWGNLGTDEQSVMTAKARLKYKSITAKEWEQIFNFFMELETLGFKYDDLYNNLELGRDKNFMLNVLLKDLESEGHTDILKEIQDIGNTFNSYGLKEPAPNIDNKDLLRDESFFFPY